MAKKKSSGGKPPRKAGKKRPSKPPRKKGRPSGRGRASKRTAGKKKPSRKKASGRKATMKTKKKLSRKKASTKTRAGAARKKSTKKKAARKKAPAKAQRRKATGKKAGRRDKAFFEHFRRRLLEERERIGRRLDGLRDELSGLQEMPRELEEWAQEEKDRDILIRLEEREANELRRIQAALERIDDGRYGLCQICGRAIPRDRLEELPTAFRCIEHMA